MKRLLLIVVLLAVLIPPVLSYSQDFQNYDGSDMVSAYGANFRKFPYSETQQVELTTGGAGLGGYIYYPNAQPATNWSVVIRDKPPLAFDGGEFQFYRDTTLLVTITDANFTSGINNRYDFVLDTSDMRVRTYVNGTYRQVSAVLAQTPNYFYAGGYSSAFVTYLYVDDYIISPSPSADAATRNIIETLPYDYYIVLDSLNPGNNGLYNGSGLVTSGFYYNKFSTVSNASKTIQIVNLNIGTVYDSQNVWSCANETRWSIATLAASGAPTGLYAFRWTEAGYGAHTSNPFYVTRGAATVTWDSSTYYTDNPATTSWNIQAGYWTPAAYTYTGEIVDAYGTVKKSWTISPTTGQTGTEVTVLDGATYPAGVYFTQVKRTLIASPFTVETLGYDYAEVFQRTSIVGLTYNASAAGGTLLPRTSVNITQSGVATTKLSTTTYAQYNISGLTNGAQVNLSSTYGALMHVPVYFTPLTYGNFTINQYLTSDPKNQTRVNNTIYGLVQSTPYYAAEGGATVYIWNATAYTTNITNASGFYIFNGLVPDADYWLNATKTAFINTTPQSVNTSELYKGVKYNCTREDFLLTRAYELQFNIKEAGTSATILNGTITITNGFDTWSETTTTGSANFTLDYGLYSYTVTETGYYPGTGTILLDSDDSITVYLTQIETQVASTWFIPRTVTLVCTDYWNNPIPGLNITAVPINFTAPDNWVQTYYGIPTVNNLSSTTLLGISASDGSWAAPMAAAIRYNFTFSGIAGIPTYTLDFYPSAEEYYVRIPTAGVYVPPTPATSFITYTMGNFTVNTTHEFFNVTYQDTSGGTTVVSLNITNVSGYPVWNGSVAIAGTGVYNLSSGLVAHTAGETYIYSITAPQSQIGFVNQTNTITWENLRTLAGYPAWVSQWLGIGLLIVLAGSFSLVSVKYGMVILPILTYFMTFYAKWLTPTIGTTTFFLSLGILLALGIGRYLRDQRNKLGNKP